MRLGEGGRRGVVVLDVVFVEVEGMPWWFNSEITLE